MKMNTHIDAKAQSEMAAHRETTAADQERLAGLPSKLRLVVLLRYAHQLSFAEIDQQLQMPTGTAKAYFHRARPLLRATLTAQGQTDPLAG